MEMVHAINNDKTFNVTDNCLELMDGIREIRTARFENLRTPLNNPEILSQLATLADEIIAAKKNGDDISVLENETNNLVCQLYGMMDDEETEVVEKR